MVGDLHMTKDGVPVFIIGHHILYGKVANIERPLVLMEKCCCGDGGIRGEGQEEASTEYRVRAVIRKKFVFKTRPKPIIANVPKKV